MSNSYVTLKKSLRGQTFLDWLQYPKYFIRLAFMWAFMNHACDTNIPCLFFTYSQH